MTQKGRRTRKTPFSGYNFLKFAILEVLYKQKRDDNNKYLDAKQILEKLAIHGIKTVKLMLDSQSILEHKAFFGED